MRGVYQRGKVWWIRYRFEGRLVRKAIGYDKRLAEESITAIKGDIVRAEHRLKRKDDRRLFKELAEEYIEEKVEKRSLSRDKASLKNLLPAFQHKFLDSITRKDIEDYARRRKGQVSGATTNREIALIRHMFNIAIVKGYLEQNPARGVKRFQEGPWRHKYVFSELEIQRLMAAAAPHLRPILMIAFGTGLRKGDILGLRWTDIDLDRGIITLYMQKTREPIEIPMLPMVMDLLRRMENEAKIRAREMGGPMSPFVFASRWPNRWSGELTKLVTIRTSFCAALRRSKLAERGYRFHDIRRTFATMLYNKGVILTKIQRLLGHKSVLTTERYLGVKFEETRQAIQVLDQPLSRALAEASVSAICAQSPERPAEINLLSETCQSKALPS
jgi:integrase